MENKIPFEDEGLRALALIILSCYPVHQELNINAMMYIKDVLKGKRELDGRTLLDKLPALENSISKLARKLGYKKISRQNVAEFFTGNDHYEKILSEFEENKLHIVPNSIFSLRTIFAHLIMPIRIVGKDTDGFVGKYQNGKFEFEIKGLIASKVDKEIIQKMLAEEKEIMVLSHFATVIVANPDRKLVTEINEMHNHLELLRKACTYLQSHGGVNYNVFPVKCTEKTKAVFDEIDL